MKFLKVKDNDFNSIDYYPMCNIVSLEKYSFNENEYRVEISLTDGRTVNCSTRTSTIAIVDNIEL